MDGQGPTIPMGADAGTRAETGPAARGGVQTTELVEALVRTARLMSAQVEPITFGELCERYLTDLASVSNAKSTYARQSNLVRSIIVPYFGPLVQAAEIRPEDCQRFVAARIAQGCTSATAKKSLDQLKTIMACGVSWGYLAFNPATGIRPPKGDLVEMDFLTAEELARFLEAASPEWRPLFYVLSLLGLRGGEALGLKWQDVDFDEHCVHVRRAWSEGRYVVPKTRSSVCEVPMGPTVGRELERHLLAKAHESDAVFATSSGRPIDWNNVRKRAFYPALDQAGIRRMPMHSLRHTYASLLIAQGESLKMVQQLMGHSSIKTTADRYGHLVRSDLNPAAVRLEESVFGKG